MLHGIRANPAACAAAVADPLLLATDLADYLVNRGTPFRKAHEIIARAVGLSVERAVPLPKLSLADYQGLSPVFADDLYAVFDLGKAMSARRAIGAPSPENVAAQLARWQAALA
jgi:argininosuccinate lyase